jgi:hypothetical protein
MILDLMPGGPILTFTTADLDPVVISTYRCPRGTKVTLSQEKLFSVTKVPGRSGSVKEFSGVDDFKLTIEFEYVGMNKLLAQRELVQIKKVWRLFEALKITNSKINKLGIKYVVLTRIDFPNEERLHELPVRLEALSDDPEIDLTKPDDENIQDSFSVGDVVGIV